MRLMTVEECFFRCRLAVCSFFFSINFTQQTCARAHTHTHVHIDLQGPALLRGHRSTGAVRGFRPWDREDVGLSPRSSHSSVFVCDTWYKDGTSLGTG